MCVICAPKVGLTRTGAAAPPKAWCVKGQHIEPAADEIPPKTIPGKGSAPAAMAVETKDEALRGRLRREVDAAHCPLTFLGAKAGVGHEGPNGRRQVFFKEIWHWEIFIL
mmetsp:Transcript_3683/g.5547  ORF Transcript_3683/g.5547 Transcript_3683/m.5547 type:complete len:110 (+) Transcript_3683:140-469(+)